MARPQTEIRPEGLNLKWCHVWDNAVTDMKDQGTWNRNLRALLDEYVFALIAAEDARDDDEPTQWDRHAKRASALADQLALTPRGRKAVGVGDSDDKPAGQASTLDELAKRRAAAS